MASRLLYFHVIRKEPEVGLNWVVAARVCSLCWRKGNKQTELQQCRATTELQQCRAKKSCNNKLTTSAIMRSLASKRVPPRWTLLRLISRSASSSLQRKKNAPIALAAQLLDQDIELVLDDTDGAGADLHEAEPAGFDEAFVKGGLADAEALQHLTFSQDLLAGHNVLFRLHRDVRGY